MFRHALPLAAAVAITTPAVADDPFSIFVTDGMGMDLLISGSSLPDLINDLAGREADFAAFDGVAFTANVTYAGVENAIVVMYDPSGSSDTIDIQLLGVSIDIPEFSEADGDLGEQLEDFFLEDNPGLIADFLNALNERSFVSVADGSPLSTTARSAQYKFDRFGLFSDLTPTGIRLSSTPASSPVDFGRFADTGRRGAGVPSASRSSSTATNPVAIGSPTIRNASYASVDAHEVSATRNESKRLFQPVSETRFSTRIDFAAHSFETDSNLDGYDLSLAPSSEFAFSDNMSIVFGLPLGYHEVSGAEVYNAGAHVDVPIRIIAQGDDKGFTLQLTPGVALDGGGSFDFAAGALLFSYGGSAAASFNLGPFTALTAAQFTFYESVAVSYGDIEFDPQLSQQILKVGGKLIYDFSDNGYVFGGLTLTEFVDDAAVDNYLTPTAGVGVRFQNGLSLQGSFEQDISDGFDRIGGRLALNIPLF